MRFLRTPNAELSSTRLVSFLINETSAVDAGVLFRGLRFWNLRYPLLPEPEFPTFADDKHIVSQISLGG